MSRTQVVTDGVADFSRDVRFIETNAKGVTFAPAYFIGSRPFMSIAVSHSGVNAGVTLAEIDLRFLNDFLGEAQIGKVGYAYVVDARGQVLAGSKGPEVGNGTRQPAAGRGAAEAGRRAADLGHRLRRRDRC